MRIGFSLADPRLAFWTIMGFAAKQRARELGVAISVVPATSAAEQIGVIEQFVRQRVDVLVVGPIDLEGIAGAIATARAAGIPVISTDVDIPGSQLAATVRSDHFNGAVIGAEHLARQLDRQGKIVHLQGTAGSPSAEQRAAGLYDALSRHPGIEVCFEARGDWSSASGEALMQQALAETPDIRGVFAASDPMALGAAAAVAAAGRTGEICIVGFDALPETLGAIDQGRISATVGQQPHSIGRIAVDSALRLVRGEPVEPLILTDVTLVTSASLLSSALNALEILPLAMQEAVESSAEQKRLQAEVIAAQQRIIRDLSSPIIPITDQILVLPLVGTIDTERAATIMESMLEAIGKHQAEVLIIDITGVPVVDTSVANHLLQATRAVQLLGAQAMLVGITPEVANTVVQLGIDLSSLVTKTTLQSGLEFAMAQAAKRRRPTTRQAFASS